jgi:DNA-binding MarR family transcriptional regulator
MEEILEHIAKQNEVIISLLGRIAFPGEKLREIIVKGSKKPKELVRAYNYCDGMANVTQIAKKSNVSQSSLKEAVDKWEREGIIFKIITKNEVLPLKLYRIGE